MSRPSWRSTVALVITGGCTGLLALSPWAQTPPHAMAQAVATATALPTPTAEVIPGILGSVYQPLVLGPFLGAVIALAGVLLSQRYQRRQLERTLEHQARQEALKDARSLRDRRYDRESAAFEDLILGAWSLMTVIQEQNFLVGDETETERDQRLGKLLNEALPKTRQAMIRLALDEEVLVIRDLYDQVWQTFVRYQTVTGLIKRMAQATQGMPGSSVSIDLVDKQDARRREIEALVDRLEKATRERLDRLRRPITHLPNDLP